MPVALLFAEPTLYYQDLRSR